MYCSNLACNYGIRERSSPQPPDDDCTIGLNPNTCGKNGPILAARGHCSTMCPHVVDSEFPLIEKLRSEPPPEPDDSVPPLSKQSKKMFAEGGIVEFKGPFPDAWRGVEIPTWRAKELGLIPECEDDQCTIGWTPPPNTSELVAKMKKDEGGDY